MEIRPSPAERKPLTMKPYALFALTILVGFLWLKACHDPQVRHDALQDVRDDSLRVELDARGRKLDSLVQSADSIQGHVDRLRSQLEYNRSQIGYWQDSTLTYRAALDSLIAEHGPADSALVLSIKGTIRGLEGQRDACFDGLAVCDSVNLALDTRIALQDSAQALLRQSLEGARGAWEAAVKERNRYRSPWALGVALGYGVTLADGRVWAGPSVAVGLTYRFTFRLF